VGNGSAHLQDLLVRLAPGAVNRARLRLFLRRRRERAAFQAALATGRIGITHARRKKLRPELPGNDRSVDVAATRELLRRACRRYIDVPEFPPPGENNEHWAYSVDDDEYRLTLRGFSVVQERILARRKLKLEMWVPLATALTGLGGIAVALATLLLKR